MLFLNVNEICYFVNFFFAISIGFLCNYGKKMIKRREQVEYERSNERNVVHIILFVILYIRV